MVLLHGRPALQGRFAEGLFGLAMCEGWPSALLNFAEPRLLHF